MPVREAWKTVGTSKSLLAHHGWGQLQPIEERSLHDHADCPRRNLQQMSTKKRYRDLMERIRQSHQEFTEVWNRVRTTELLKRNIDPRDDSLANQERMEKIWKANGVAYETARPQSDRRDDFLSILFEELPFEDFLEGRTEAIDAILDFLEIDVLAFRCGYVKQWCYHKLKSLPVNQKQTERLRRLALDLCQCSGQRRELRELARLLIKLADKPLLQELRLLADEPENKYTRQKAQRVLQVILNSRLDLR